METLGDLGTEPLLTAEEETALARRIEAGLLARAAREAGGLPGADEAELRRLEDEGEQARRRFVRANLRLVAMVALPAAARSRLPATDLFQEGCLGLLVAVQRFDHERPVRFATYALYWIRAHVQVATARGLGELNLPGSRATQLRLVRGLEAELVQTLGRHARVEEVAAAAGRTATWTADLLAFQPPSPLDPADADRVAVPGPEAGFDVDRPGRELLAVLDETGREVLELRLGFRGRVHSYVETARLLAITPSRVRRVEERALDRLRAVCPQSASAYLRSA